jgi:hypothetical protein
LFVATVALVLPTLPAGAAPAVPTDYQPFCEQGYQGLKPLWDAILPPGKALFGPLEKNICGEQKHTPTAA